MKSCDILVIGGGPAGMAAALGARAAGCGSIVLAERSERLGGILNQCLHHGFGVIYFGAELTGAEYAERYLKKLRDTRIDIMTGTAVVSLGTDGTALLSGAACGFIQVAPKAVILASGCRERPIGTLPVTGTRPSGIFTAGMAQKLVNLGGYDIGSRFIILGSGDVGLIMARHLTLLGKTVLAVLEQEIRCGGLERNRRNCLDAFNIPLRTRTTVTRVHGRGRLEGVTILNLDTGREAYIACDTLLTSVGLIPERELSEEAAGSGTLPDWLFLCGNACYVHDLVDDVTVESEHVGREAARFIREGYRVEPQRSTPDNDPISGDAVCIACPKGCVLTQTKDGWLGAVCGRKDPVVLKPEMGRSDDHP